MIRAAQHGYKAYGKTDGYLRHLCALLVFILILFLPPLPEDGVFRPW